MPFFGFQTRIEKDSVCQTGRMCRMTLKEFQSCLVNMKEIRGKGPRIVKSISKKKMQLLELTFKFSCIDIPTWFLKCNLWNVTPYIIYAICAIKLFIYMLGLQTNRLLMPSKLWEDISLAHLQCDLLVQRFVGSLRLCLSSSPHACLLQEVSVIKRLTNVDMTLPLKPASSV